MAITLVQITPFENHGASGPTLVLKTVPDRKAQADREEAGSFIVSARSFAIGIVLVAIAMWPFNWGQESLLMPVVVSYIGLAIALPTALFGLLGTIGARTADQMDQRGIFCTIMAIVATFAAMPAIYQFVINVAIQWP